MTTVNSQLPPSDTLMHLREHGHITLAEYSAGQRWRKIYAAGDQHGLDRAAMALGRDGYWLVRDVLGAGLTIEQAGTARGFSGAGELRYIGRRFRECLGTLARDSQIKKNSDRLNEAQREQGFC